MHVLRAVRHDDPIDDVGVMQRLGEVVDHLLTVVLASDHRGAGLCAVERALVDQALDGRLLAWAREADLGGESGQVAAGDT